MATLHFYMAIGKSNPSVQTLASNHDHYSFLNVFTSFPPKVDSESKKQVQMRRLTPYTLSLFVSAGAVVAGYELLPDLEFHHCRHSPRIHR